MHLFAELDNVEANIWKIVIVLLLLGLVFLVPRGIHLRRSLLMGRDSHRTEMRVYFGFVLAG